MYYIRVSSVRTGSFFVSLLSTTESFDICHGAKLLSFEDASAVHIIMGSTAEATNSDDAAYFIDETSTELKNYCNEPYSKSPGVWYKMMIGSNAQNISVDSCVNGTGFQPVLSVLEGFCQIDDLTCASSVTYGYCNGEASWYAKANKTYYIFVFGKEKADKGNFTLSITRSCIILCLKRMVISTNDCFHFSHHIIDHGDCENH